MRRLIPVALLLLAGCMSHMDQLRGHNIRMGIDAVQSVKKDYDEFFDKKSAAAETDEEKEEIELERQRAEFDLNDAEDRLRLAQRDFPAPKVKKDEEPVKRGTLEEPSEEDKYRRDAYSGELYKRESRRAAWQRFLKVAAAPFQIIGWVIDIAIYVIVFGVIIFLIVVGRRLYGYGLFLIRLLPVIVPDKEKRREIAGGTPVEAVYHKEKRRTRNGNGNGVVSPPAEPQPAQPAPAPAPAPKSAPAPKPAPVVVPKPKPQPQKKKPPKVNQQVPPRKRR